MDREQAVAEILGAILLIGIIVGAFAIFTAIYVPTLKIYPPPSVKLSMACNTTVGAGDTEFPCTRGSFNCHPFNNRTCEEDCKWRDYSQNPDLSSDQHNREIVRCMEDCMSPICSDLRNCGVLYICHNGGDSLNISDIKIFVNGNAIARNFWGIKNQSVTPPAFVSPPPEGWLFRNGDSLSISDPGGGRPVNTVMIVYSPQSGQEIILALNQFGTDVT